MKPVVCAFVLLLSPLLASGAVASAASPAAAPPAEVVVVRGSTADGRHALGAGVLVLQHGRRKIVLTAAHVARLHDVTVEFSDGRRVAAGAARFSPELDLAELAVQTDGFYAVASIGSAEPAAGEPVTILGHPLGALYTRSDARIVVNRDGVYAVRCGNCDAGDSGAPVFDRNGNAVGIIFASGRIVWSGAKAPDPELYELPITLAAIRRFVGPAIASH